MLAECCIFAVGTHLSIVFMDRNKIVSVFDCGSFAVAAFYAFVANHVSDNFTLLVVAYLLLIVVGIIGLLTVKIRRTRFRALSVGWYMLLTLYGAVRLYLHYIL